MKFSQSTLFKTNGKIFLKTLIFKNLIMKKTLLFIIFAMIVSISFPQIKFAEIRGENKNLRLEQTQVHPNQTGNYSGYVIGQKFLDYSTIGTTWYDAQTVNYGNVMQRMWYYPDGTIGSTWLSAGEDLVPERGTGYNYFDGSEWGIPDMHVGPEDRMGSPSYAPWGSQGEIIAQYRYIAGEGPIRLYRREIKGEGEWEETEVSNPNGVSLVWHSMCTSGENFEYIHILAYTYDAPYQGQDNALLYYRSSDGGETWDVDGEIIEGLGSGYIATINSLSYAWANPVGNTIAFTYGFDEFGGRVFKSDDNGDEWEIIDVFESPFDPFEPPTDADPFGCGLGSSACALDSEGNAHVVFTRMVKLFEGGEVKYYPYTDGLIYWNETMDVLDTSIISSYTMEYLEEGGNLVGWVISDEPFEIPAGQPNYANGLCAYPQISIDADNNMFVAYSSIAPGYTNGSVFFRHIVTNSSFDGGSSWNGQVDLNTDLLFWFSECAFPTMAPIVDDSVHVVFQEDSEPGTFEWPSEQSIATENNLIHMPFDKGFFVGISDELEITGFELSEGYPNPAVYSVTFNIKLENASDIEISILNFTGQLIKEIRYQGFSSGNNRFTINVSDIVSGVYYFTITAGEQMICRKILINK